MSLSSRVKTVLLLLALALPLRSQALDVLGQQKLAAQLELPATHVELGFSYTRSGTFLWGGAPEPTEAKIRQLEEKVSRGAREGQVYLELGGLYHLNGQSDRAREALGQAAESYRSRLESQPEDEAATEGLCEALLQNGEAGTAEEILSKFLHDHPKAAQCWAALGEAIGERAFELLTGETNYSACPLGLNQLYADVLAHLPLKDSSVISNCCVRAEECLGRSLRLAPRNPELYRRRMLLRYFVAMFRDMALSKDPVEGFPEAYMKFARQSSKDMKTVSKLLPRDAESLCAWLMMESVAAGSAVFEWPERTPRNIKWTLRSEIPRLKKLCKETAGPNRAVLMVWLGYFQSRAGEKGWEKTLCDAIALEPRKELAWDMLMGIYSEKDRWADILAACREKARYQDTARNRLSAAQMAERLNRRSEAMEEVLEALRLDPKNVDADIAFATLLLKSGSERDLAEAALIVQRLAEAKDLTQDQWRSVTFLGGVYYALRANREESVRWLKAILDELPNDKAAKAALELVAN
jgi:tetratricopeptide (TPR) repeat protein